MAIGAQRHSMSTTSWQRLPHRGKCLRRRHAQSTGDDLEAVVRHDLTPSEGGECDVDAGAEHAQEFRQRAFIEARRRRFEDPNRLSAELVGGYVRQRQTDHEIPVVGDVDRSAKSYRQQTVLEAIQGTFPHRQYHHPQAVRTKLCRIGLVKLCDEHTADLCRRTVQDPASVHISGTVRSVTKNLHGHPSQRTAAMRSPASAADEFVAERLDTRDHLASADGVLSAVEVQASGLGYAAGYLVADHRQDGQPAETRLSVGRVGAVHRPT
ncbi:hypothetical protein [Dactylosporangium sp. NPDC005555]|uniref:hypothetical protein n=1 Tax=Dactylosporangium sp. NPDC005555 TaxID=3154889 RepID=UPI00339FA439